MCIYRITYLTRCGKRNIVVESGNCYAEAYHKAQMHVERKHTKMKLIAAEYKDHNRWYMV